MVRENIELLQILPDLFESFPGITLSGVPICNDVPFNDGAGVHVEENVVAVI